MQKGVENAFVTERMRTRRRRRWVDERVPNGDVRLLLQGTRSQAYLQIQHVY